MTNNPLERLELTVQTGACIQLISDFTYPCTTAAWAPSGKHVIIGSQDDKLGCGIWDLSGNLVHTFSSPSSSSPSSSPAKIRPNDLAISPDGQRLVVVSECSIFVFDLESYERLCEWQLEDVKLTSVSISADSRHMLVSMNQDRIRLMEIDTGEVVQRFEGHSQRQFIVRSAFGGADENFVVSGSEGTSPFTLISSPFTFKLLISDTVADCLFQIQGSTYGGLTAC